MKLPDWPLVSVIILNHDGRRILGKILNDCLLSVLNAEYPNFEVLFVDNASDDDSVAFVEKTFGQDPRLRVILNAKNLGYAQGNNVGIKNARGKYVVLLNTDTCVDAAWLKNLVIAAEPPDVGAVQSKLVQMNAPELLDSAGGMLDYYGYHFERGRGEKVSQYRHAVNVFYGKGASLLLKCTALKSTGLFDPDIFLYFDEVDLCWRLRLAGYRVVYAPSSFVKHLSGSTASKLQDKMRTYFYTRNHLMVLLKNLELKNALRVTKISVLFEARNALLNLLRLKPQLSHATFKALFWNLASLKRTWEKRQQVQILIRKVPDSKIRRMQLKPYPPFPLYLLYQRSRYKLRETEL